MSDEICRCSHPKEFHQSFLKEVPCDYDGKCVVGCQKFEPVGPDRHPKWQRVEPGTVIPAGQPYMVEREIETGGTMRRAEYITHDETHVPAIGPYSPFAYFIDSSWKPPLVLPTEPTWGIVVCPKPKGMSKGTYSVHDEPFAMVGRWAQYGSEPDVLTRTNRDFQTRFDTLDIDFITDFIPLTDEQVARIEAAR